MKEREDSKRLGPSSCRMHFPCAEMKTGRNTFEEEDEFHFGLLRGPLNIVRET